MTSLTEVAAGTGATDLLAAAVRLLTPYRGRGVVNAGAAAFAGVVDDYLYMALRAQGETFAADDCRQTAAAAYRRMGAAWWLGCVSGLGSGGGAARPSEVMALHATTGGVWLVGRPGSSGMLPDRKGLRHLRMLLGRPGVDVPALDLSAAAAGHPGVRVPRGDVGPHLDAQARSAYRRRLVHLDEELAEARAWADPARVARLDGERAALIAELARAAGLGGRSRRSGDAGERARVAVRKAIAAAIAAIEQVDPVVGRQLQNTIITGAFCRYDPDPGRPVRWVLDDRPAVPAPGWHPAPGS